MFYWAARVRMTELLTGSNQWNMCKIRGFEPCLRPIHWASSKCLEWQVSKSGRSIWPIVSSIEHLDKCSILTRIDKEIKITIYEAGPNFRNSKRVNDCKEGNDIVNLVNKIVD